MIRQVLIAALIAGGLPLAAQVSSVRIAMSPGDGIAFTVDGSTFLGVATFLWPQGSKHTVSVSPVEYGNTPKTQYAFTGWTVTGGTTSGTISDLSFVITADPQLRSVVASFDTAYAFDLVFYNCPADAGVPCWSPGTIFVNETAAYIQTTHLYAPAGTKFSLRASPNPGYIFTGWLNTPGAGTGSNLFIASYTLNAPLTVYPQFQSSRPVSISLLSNPPGLKILADRTPLDAPASLDWGTGTTHTVGVISPQADTQGKVWIFDSWSDGGDTTHDYKVPDILKAASITAYFTPALRVTFLTNPGGLKLSINGRTDWLSYTFSAAGQTMYHLSAPMQQTDSRGLTNQFVSWSNSGAAIQDYLPQALENRLTANYEVMGKVILQSSPPGLKFRVSGADCVAPCIFDRSQGAQMTVSPPPSITLSDSARLDFNGWQDSNAVDRTVTFNAGIQTLTATYQPRYRVTTGMLPAGGGAIALQPASFDGFYDANAQVQVSVTANPGFRFRSWQGDGSPALTVSSPKTVTAVFDPAPYLPPAAVQNAAANTPPVAPGSVVSIFGLNLAADMKVGPASPLVQTLLNVTVRMGDTILPLFFVSPQQINVQLPFETPAGPQTLIAHQEGQPEVRADFTVVRNAPGLFATALHEDGSAITADSPTVAGETVTLTGTGFGPYDRMPPDGLLIPKGATFQLTDPVVLSIGDTPADTLFAGASSDGVGLNVIRFRAAGSAPRVKITVNGIDSNSIALP